MIGFFAQRRRTSTVAMVRVYAPPQPPVAMVRVFDRATSPVAMVKVSLVAMVRISASPVAMVRVLDRSGLVI